MPTILTAEMQKKIAPPQATLMDQAKKEFPILNKHDIGYKENYGGGQGYLEFWPGYETGTPEQPRPKEFPMGKPGVEVYDKTTRPIDIMGDVASHYLIEKDPVIKEHYQQFEQSLTDKQKGMMKEQYRYSQQHEGETRPFDQWREHSGLPGYFRGYAFDQWKDPKSMYTPEQLKKLDDMMKYLRKKD